MGTAAVPRQTEAPEPRRPTRTLGLQTIRSPECPDSVCTSLVYTTFREPDASTKEFSMAQAIALPTRPHYGSTTTLSILARRSAPSALPSITCTARHADRKTGLCYPCIGTIAKKLALGRTTVKKYLQILLNHSLIYDLLPPE